MALEEGIDEGGVQKEFFQLIFSQIFDVSYGMFVYDDDARLCAVCLDAPKDAALVPCGHRTCRGCARALRRRKLPCPSCRQPIDGTIKVY